MMKSSLNLLFFLFLAATTFARPHNSTHHCHRKNGTHVHKLNTTPSADAGIASSLAYSPTASISILATVPTSSTTVVEVVPSSDAAIDYALTANSYSVITPSSVLSIAATPTATTTESIVVPASASSSPAVPTDDQTTFVSLHNNFRLHYGALFFRAVMKILLSTWDSHLT